MDKDFCLSNSRKDVDYETDNYVWCYPEEDVKKFIKLLKEETDKLKYNYGNNGFISRSDFYAIIDKLAGEKLND